MLFWTVIIGSLHLSIEKSLINVSIIIASELHLFFMFKLGRGVEYPFTKGIVINRDPRTSEVSSLGHPVGDKFAPKQNKTGKGNDKPPQIEFEALEEYIERTASSNEEYNPEYRSETVLFNRKFKFPE